MFAYCDGSAKAFDDCAEACNNMQSSKASALPYMEHNMLFCSTIHNTVHVHVLLCMYYCRVGPT